MTCSAISAQRTIDRGMGSEHFRSEEIHRRLIEGKMICLHTPFNGTLCKKLSGAIAAFLVLTTQARASDTELDRCKTAQRIGQEHLKKFDTPDFDIYTNQKWERFKENHSPDILVHYPDGHTTKGLAAHIAALKPQFVFAPDTRIREHPVKIESGEWTSVVGDGGDILPTQTPNGPIAPTGKTFKIICPLSAIGRTALWMRISVQSGVHERDRPRAVSIR
jgi:hypothetical protein